MSADNKKKFSGKHYVTPEKAGASLPRRRTRAAYTPSALVGDIALAALFIILLACMLLMSQDTGSVEKNALLLTAAFAVMLITHFTNITVGLVTNIIVIFAYASYLIITVITEGAQVTSGSYVFMAGCPLLSVCIHLAFRNSTAIEQRNVELSKRVASYTMLDEATGLKTERALEGDLKIYRAIAERYKLKVVFVLWGYRYPAELSRMLGAGGLAEVSKKISGLAANALRSTDAVYLIGDNLWGALTISSSVDEQAVIDRLRGALDKKRLAGENGPRIDLRFGAAADMQPGGKARSASELIELAEAKMEYDV